MFIVFEGVDGSGKTTLSSRTAEWQKGLGFAVYHTYEPSDGPVGRNVKAAVSDIDPLATVLLFMADRAWHVREIEKKLSEGWSVICDRYIYSTLAYQGAQLENMAWDDFHRWVMDIWKPFELEPDIVILLDIKAEDGLKRIKRGQEYFENAEFLKKVRQNYTKLLDDRFRVIDASRKPDEVFEDVKNALTEWLQSRGHQV